MTNPFDPSGRFDIEPEEPWEADVAAMLGGLAPVDPPPGFIAAAIDHRPLNAGRIMAGLVLASLLALGAALAAGAAPRPSLRIEGLRGALSTAPETGDDGAVNNEALSDADRTDETAFDSLGDRVDELARSIVGQLGFPS